MREGSGQADVAIRADGGPELGTGHIMRCLSIADAFRKRGRKSVFITADGQLREIIEERGYACIVLGTAHDQMDAELPAFLPVLKELCPACLLIDSYYVTPRYMEAVRQLEFTAYVDDLNLFDYPADLVINYNFYGSSTPYPEGKQYLLGPRYAPLREEFRGLPRRVAAERASRILFSTGGADHEHVALGCMRYLRERRKLDRLTFHVVLGAMNRDADEIGRIADGAPNIVLHRQIKDMCALMLHCDAAIAAAGSTLYELCACGLPTLTYVLADNQIRGAEAAESAGLMWNAGDIRRNPQWTEHLFSKLDGLIQDWPSAAGRMSEKMQSMVDGRGAERIAEAVLSQREASKGLWDNAFQP